MTRIAAAFLLCTAVFAPAAARAAAGEIPVFSTSGVAVAVDPTGEATIESAAGGALPFVPVGDFTFPHSAAALRPLTVWVRVPAEPRWSGGYSVETPFDVAHATLYTRGPAGWSAIPFGMAVPYAQRSVARLAPTARIVAPPGSPLYLRLQYLVESPDVTIVDDAAIDRPAFDPEKTGPLLLIFTGFFVALAISNLVLYGFALQRTYWIYSVAMLFAAVSTGVLGQPFAWKWFWPQWSPPYYLTFIAVACGFEFSMVFFTAQLLRLREFWPSYDRAVRIFMIAGAAFGIAFALWLASARIGTLPMRAIVEPLAIVPFAMMVVAGIVAWRRGDPTAPFVVGGYVCHTIGIALYFATPVPMRSGIFPALGTAIDGMLLFAALAARLQRLQREAVENAIAAAEQRRLAYTDGLTGVANRRAYDEALAAEWERSSREGTWLSMILIDVDYFKRYNDTYGHAAGDECLQRIAAAAKACTRRPADLFARYGGEEFVALLPATTEAAALEIARHMCEAVRAMEVAHATSSLGVVSISVGVASAIAPPLHEPTLARDADAALYEAKRGGRNRVVSASTSSSDSGAAASG